MPATESRSAVGLLDIVGQLPGVLVDAPQIVRAVSTGMFARPTSKTSIGKVFQERAEKYADRVFLRFGDQQITYAQANATANRYASVLADRGVGRGDVVGIMLRNSPNAVLMMLATVKCGAVAGMLNYHQRGDVLAHSIGLLKATTIVAESDLVEHITESGAEVAPGVLLTVAELEQLAESAPTANPASASEVRAKDTAFYIFTSGTTGHPKGVKRYAPTPEQTASMEAMRALMAEYKQRIRAEHTKIYSQDLLNNLFRHPYTRIDYVQSELGVSRPTATKYLDELAESGLLAKQRIGRNNYYINQRLVALFLDGTGPAE